MGAFVGSLARVGAPMYAQIILRDESFAAEIADVRFLAGVLAQMNGQVRLAGDGLAADRADVLFLRSHVPVGLHVDQQHLFPRETFVAQLAVMLPLRRHVIGLMQLRVQPEALSITEGRVADVALKGFLVRVHVLMLLVAVLRYETRTAHLAFVLVVDVVTFLVSDQALPVIGDETAGLATVRLVRFVFQLMIGQFGRGGETATAVLADQMVVLYLNDFVFVNFYVHSELLVGHETVTAQIALNDTVGDDHLGVLHLRHVQTIIRDEHLFRIFLFVYHVGAAFLLFILSCRFKL